MSKMFKTAKQVLSVALALAVMACSLFTGVAFGVEASASISDTWDGTKVEPTETDGSGNIIIRTAEELAWVALLGGDATQNKNYKVADNAVFNMNGMEGIEESSTLAQVKEAVKTTNYWRLEADGSSPAFQGNFDGNGLIVYNLYTGTGRSHCGLFPATNSTAQTSITIKNVSVVASHIGGYHGAGALVGIANTGNTSTTMLFENCAVKNCFIYDNEDANPATKKIGGIFAGEISHNAITFKNCLAIDNQVASQGIQGGFFGNSSNYAGQSTVINSITIGATAEPVSINTALATKVATTTYTNVYTDQTSSTEGVTTLTDDEMKGAAAKENMPALDWSVLIAFENQYPDFRSNHNLTATEGDENGHTVSCADCDGSITEEHVFEKNDEYTLYSCICGLESALPQNEDTWDGTKVEPTVQDKDGNYIIRTAEELAWIALQGAAATAGKNYKVAPNSVFNLNGMEGITLDSTLAEVKEVGDVKASTYNYDCAWHAAADARTYAFQGNFDGNGLVVYNLFTAKGRSDGGLFPLTTPATAESTQVFKNVTVVASHIGGYHYAGGIVGFAKENGTTAVVNFENCVVENSFIYDNNDSNATCQRTAGAIVGSVAHNGSTLSNCMAINNQISAQGITGGLIGTSSAYGGALKIQNSISIGTTVIPTAGSQALGGKIANMTIANVYTDQASSTEGVTTLTADEMKGAAAKENMPALDWSVYVALDDEYPSFRSSHDFVATSDDELTHTVTCTVCAGSTTETHVLVKNEEYTESTCLCGYSEEVKENLDDWDGTKVEPTVQDKDGNYIIRTAEEFAWIALQGGAATQGKNYKVSPYSVFDMKGMEGITVDSTAADVEAATKAANWSTGADNTGNAFGGNLDGNGVVIYNVSGYKYGYGGLFPVTCPVSNETVTIKNLTVVASDLRGYHNAGGIIGLANAPDTSTKTVLENCTVKNCVITDGADANTACQRTVGTHIGNAGHNNTTLNNCLAVGNKLSGQGINGGFVGNLSGYNAGLAINNSIALGTTAHPTEVANTLSAKYANAVYTNVYTDQLSDKEGITTVVDLPSTCIWSGDPVTVPAGETVFFEIGTDGVAGEYDFVVEGTGAFDVTTCTEGTLTDFEYTAGEKVSAVDGKVETTITSYESTYCYAAFGITNNSDADADYVCTIVYPLGTQGNPESVTLAVGGTATVTVPSGAQYYVSATLPQVGTEYMMTVTGNTGFGFLSGWGMPVPDTNGTYVATVMGQMWTGGAASFSIINNTDSEQTYTLALDNMPLGAQSNPDTLEIGETVTKDLTSEYWYTWTATAKGTLKLTMDNDACTNGWTYNLQNQSTGDVFNFSTYWDESDKNVAELAVNEGDVIALAVSVEPYAQTAGTVVFATEFEELTFTPDGENYSICSKPLSVGTKTYAVDPNYTYTAFVFSPTEDGKYTISTTDSTIGIVSYTDMWVLNPPTPENVAYTSVEWECTAVGQGIYIAVLANEVATITVTREDLQVEPEIPWTYYENTAELSAFTFTGKINKFVDITDATADAAVLGEDGYYHLNTVDGPILYVDLDDATKMNLVEALGTGQLKHIVSEGGEVVSKTDYNSAFAEYLEVADEETGLYPLTADLMEIYQNVGANGGWYGAEGWVGGELSDAWMFACCYELVVRGDADGNGELEAADAALFTRYLAGWDVEINLDVLDVNTDGKVSAKDLVLITRKLSNWDVTLG